MQDVAKIETLLTKTDQQAAAISTLQIKLEQTQLASFTHSSVALVAIQYDNNAIFCDLDRPCADSSHSPVSAPQPPKEDDAHIHFVDKLKLIMGPSTYL